MAENETQEATEMNGAEKAVEEEKPEKVEEEEPELIENEVTLSWYDSDLNLQLDRESLCSASPLGDGRFSRLWAGARATHGYTEGKICFQAKIIELIDVSKIIYTHKELLRHQLRVGWSIFDASLQLGEEPFSYALDSCNKAFENCNHKDYGKKFGSLDDVVTAYADFTGESVILSFSLNGHDLGEAYSIDKNDLEGKALAPHVLSKNIKFEVNFGRVAPWGGTVKEDYTFAANVPLGRRTRGPRAPPSREDCECIILCGLPASGKTTWTEEHVKANPDRRYTVLSIAALAKKMTVMGVPRKLKVGSSYEGPSVKCLEKLMSIGCHRTRNYILDQTSWKRKAKIFDSFYLKGVVIVPTLEEYRRRVAKQVADGERYVSEADTYDVTSKYSLPEESMFKEVMYPELRPGDLEAVMEVVTNEAKEKFAKIASEAKQNPRRRDRGNRDQRGGSSGPGPKRMRGGFDGSYSTSYPLKRPPSPYVRPHLRGGILGPGGPLGPIFPGRSAPPSMPFFGSSGRGRMGASGPPRGPPPLNRPYGNEGRSFGNESRPFSNGNSKGGPDGADWGRWWNTEGRKLYGRWLSQHPDY